MPMDEKMLVYWIWLEGLRGISRKEKMAMLELYQTPKAIYNKKVHPLMQTQMDLSLAKDIVFKSDSLGCQYLTPDNPHWQKGGPFVMYTIGAFSPDGVAVVGTRKCSGESYHVTRAVVKKMGDEGLAINSGLSVGIDHMAHRLSIEEGVKTQAFLVHGMDACYPKVNYKLFKAIKEKGALITGFPVGTAVKSFHFAYRSEWMALYSESVVVVEAPENSGSTQTAAFALDQSKPVWLCESNLLPRTTAHSHLLDLGAKKLSLSIKAPEVSPDIRAVLKRIKRKPASLDRLLKGFQGNPEHLKMALLGLEMEKWVALRPNGTWTYFGGD